MDLDVSAAAAGVRLIARDAVSSTNAEALALARAGEAGPVWVTATSQSAGRGRRGRTWQSPAGNLYASLLLTDPCAAECTPQLSFVAALALHEAIAELPAAAARLMLKWPNDLMLDGKKLAGILVEGENLPDGKMVAVIGVGVNCVSYPADTPYSAIDLRAAGVTATPAEVFGLLSAAMLRRLDQWARGMNFAAVRNDWLLRTARLGEPILLRAAPDVRGAFAGLDEHGRLLLRVSDGVVRSFTAAEVHLPSAPDREWTQA